MSAVHVDIQSVTNLDLNKNNGERFDAAPQKERYMERVAKFEKVSLEKTGWLGELPKTEKYLRPIEEMYEELKLPIRATSGSAGYDFFAPYDFKIQPGESITIKTGIRVKINNGWFMLAVPKSGIGTKYYVRLANTVGVIDGDYYYSDNEGQIMATLRVEQDELPLEVKCGDKIFQAIFLPYGITFDDNAQGVRNGGHGSTGM